MKKRKCVRINVVNNILKQNLIIFKSILAYSLMNVNRYFFSFFHKISLKFLGFSLYNVEFI